MSKKNVIKKWTSGEYLGSVSRCIESIFSGQANIDGADLSGIIIGPDAFLEKLKNKSLYKAKITNSNLSYAKISGSMSNSLLKNINFKKSNLDRCILLDSHIIDCDFSHAKLVTKMDDTVCENSDFSGAKIGGGSAGLEYGGRRVKFVSCNFTGVVFSRVEFRASRFINCNFNGAKFISCDFRGAKAEGGIMPFTFQFEKMEAPEWAVQQA